MAFPDPITLGTANFTRIKPGEYFRVDSTLDEPCRFYIQSQQKSDGELNAMVKLTLAKNNFSDAALPDSVLSVHQVLRVNPRFWSESEALAALTMLGAFNTSGNILRLLRREL